MPRQRLGQNFLTDRSVAGRIIRSAHVEPSSTVVEIGPGHGALTGQLAATAGHLTVVEFDPSLAESLRVRYAGRDNIAVVEADARKVSPESLPFVRGGAYLLVGNLPYYAATPIIRNFLESGDPPESMVVMVQREVADEMRAGPGHMRMLSLAVQVYAAAEKLFDVPPDAFTPRPKVHSSVMRLTPLARPAVDVDSLQKFFRLARAGFKAPRKQMHNSLAAGLNIEGPLARSLVERAGISPERRPATLSLPEWQSLYELWQNEGEPFVVHGTPRVKKSRQEEDHSLKAGVSGKAAHSAPWSR